MEITKRELYSNLLLTIYALKKNFNIYISDTNTFKYLLKKKLINPSIIHTKSIVHGKKKSLFHKHLKDNNFIITAIDEEHGVLDELNYEKYFASNRLTNKELEKISAFFCWGSYDFDRLRKLFPRHRNKFYLTGSPRTDIWKNKNIFKNSKLNLKKPKVLICTNFSFSNNILNYKALFKKKSKEGYFRRSPGLYKKNKDFYLYQKKLIQKFVILVNSLTKKYPKINFCLRPHPTENVNYWLKNLIKRENLFITNSHSSSFWINKSKIVIQSGCTTGGEALISKKLVINYVPLKQNVGFGEYLKKVSINAYNEEDVFNIIENQKKYSFNKISQTKLNKRILFRNNLAAFNISKIWSILTNKDHGKKNDLIRIRNNLFLLEKFKHILLKSILLIKGKKNKFKSILSYKYPNLSQNYVENEINNLSNKFNMRKKIQVKKLGKKLFYITYK